MRKVKACKSISEWAREAARRPQAALGEPWKLLMNVWKCMKIINVWKRVHLLPETRFRDWTRKVRNQQIGAGRPSWLLVNVWKCMKNNKCMKTIWNQNVRIAQRCPQVMYSVLQKNLKRRFTNFSIRWSWRTQLSYRTSKHRLRSSIF